MFSDAESNRARAQQGLLFTGQWHVIMLQLVFANTLQELLPDLSDYPAPTDRQMELQFYLVIALALISVLFFLEGTLTITCTCDTPPAPTLETAFSLISDQSLDLELLTTKKETDSPPPV